MSLQEEVQFQTKEQMSTLTEEIAKLRDLSDSLRAEVSELRQNAENLAREKTTVTEWTEGKTETSTL